MATAQKSSFITNDVVHMAVLNPHGSKSFIKKMIPVAVGFIIHQRTNLSRSDFETRKRNGVIYKVLKRKTQEPYLKNMQKWLMGILDAFEKNYLRELFLIISTVEEQPLILESYKFQFKYMGTDVIPLHSPATKEEVSEAADSLLKGIASLDQYKQFKKGEFALSTYVTYYDDVTPPDYEPPFFDDDDNSATVEKLLDNVPEHSNNYVYLGRVNTGFHVVKCCAKGDFSMDNTASTTMDLDEGMVLEERNVEKCTLHSVEEKIEMEPEDVPITTLEGSEPGMNKSLHSTSSSSECISINTFSSKGSSCIIKCMCQISAKFNYVDLVRCTVCSFFQHTTCVVEPSKGNAYMCQVCKYDQILTPNEAKQRELVSAYRLAVASAYFTKKVPEDVIDKLPTAIKAILLNKLHQIGALFTEEGKLHFRLDVFENAYEQMNWYQ